MADLGAIGFATALGFGSAPVKWYVTPVVFGKDNSSSISGQVAEVGTGVIGSCKLRLYYRDTGRLILQTRTDLAGNYSFDGLDASDLNALFVVAFDPDAGAQYNSLILDRMSPEGGMRRVYQSTPLQIPATLFGAPAVSAA